MKIIEVKIIPNSKKNLITQEDKRLKIHITAPAVDGKANKALIEVLSEYFKVKKNNISIIRGEISSIKLVQIML